MELIAGRFIPVQDEMWGSAFAAFDTQYNKANQALLIPSYDLAELRKVVIKHYEAYREDEMLNYFDHPSIPKSLHYFLNDSCSSEDDEDDDEDSENVVISYLGECEVAKHFNFYGHHMSADIAYSVTQDILDAVKHVHKKGWAHRDLHMHNMRMNDKGEGFIIDFEHADTFTMYRALDDIMRAADVFNTLTTGEYYIYNNLTGNFIWKIKEYWNTLDDPHDEANIDLVYKFADAILLEEYKAFKVKALEESNA